MVRLFKRNMLTRFHKGIIKKNLAVDVEKIKRHVYITDGKTSKFIEDWKTNPDETMNKNILVLKLTSNPLNKYDINTLWRDFSFCETKLKKIPGGWVNQNYITEIIELDNIEFEEGKKISKVNREEFESLLVNPISIIKKNYIINEAKIKIISLIKNNDLFEKVLKDLNETEILLQKHRIKMNSTDINENNEITDFYKNIKNKCLPDLMIFLNNNPPIMIRFCEILKLLSEDNIDYYKTLEKFNDFFNKLEQNKNWNECFKDTEFTPGIMNGLLINRFLINPLPISENTINIFKIIWKESNKLTGAEQEHKIFKTLTNELNTQIFTEYSLGLREFDYENINPQIKENLENIIIESPMFNFDHSSIETLKMKLDSIVDLNKETFYKISIDDASNNICFNSLISSIKETREEAFKDILELSNLYTDTEYPSEIDASNFKDMDII